MGLFDAQTVGARHLHQIHTRLSDASEQMCDRTPLQGRKAAEAFKILPLCASGALLAYKHGSQVGAVFVWYVFDVGGGLSLSAPSCGIVGEVLLPPPPIQQL
ncbi:hypothetical protein AAFF_G00176480 [Aldrovandia affinis]|uniref:Uncharacterized protein n=1 Tax=Aldrovandia affinis TaxID=143900 RepID=A0AAD7RL83_9TELE|nr:hypothetical protein AAFF_G00176480 [Aldrovandia affinis]